MATKKSKKQASGKKLDLAYHKRCQAVCKALGGNMYGSSFEGGFAFTQSKVHTEVSHDLLLRLESLLKAERLLKGVLEASKIPFKCPRDCECPCHNEIDIAKGC